MFTKIRVWVRGAGEMASGTAHLLHRLGFQVFMTEINQPLAIRRPVTFSNAVLNGETIVENVSARFCETYVLPKKPEWSYIPVFIDNPDQIHQLKPNILIDGRMLKTYPKDYRSWASLVIGLGPGFDAGINCHRVIETMRGHDLARVIFTGTSLKNTGVPGNVGGETSKRVIYASASGRINWHINFGDPVKKNQILGLINNEISIKSPLTGMVRGLISEKTPIREGLKIGDIDPRGSSVKYLNISEKARAVGAGVLEAILLNLKEHE